MRPSEEAYPVSKQGSGYVTFLKNIYCVCTFMCVGTHVIATKWRSEGITQTLALSWYVLLGTEFRPLGFVARDLYLPNHLVSPIFLFCF